MSHEIHDYTELERQIREDLRSQHPDWIKPTGECPECDEHEARLKRILDALAESGSPPAATERVLAEDKTNPTSP